LERQRRKRNANRQKAKKHGASDNQQATIKHIGVSGTARFYGHVALRNLGRQ
jgi:hypothetical protein